MITQRERYLMKCAMDAGDSYSDLEGWLSEVITDGGNTVEQLLDHEASNKDYQLNPPVSAIGE